MWYATRILSRRFVRYGECRDPTYDVSGESQCCAGAQTIPVLLTQYIITRIQNNLLIVFCVCRSFCNFMRLLCGSHRLV